MESNNIEKEIRNRRSRRRMRLNFGFIGNIVLFLPRILLATVVSLLRKVYAVVVFCRNMLVSIFNRFAYVVVLLLMLYFAMSFQFISTNLTEVLWNELPMDSREVGREMQRKIDTVFSAGPVSPWANKYRNEIVEVENSFVDYVLLLHEIDSLRLKNNDITKILTLQKTIPKIIYEETSIKKLVVSKWCENFELYASPDVETLALEEFGKADELDSVVKIENCQNLKTVEIKGECRQVQVELKDCTALETIILPANTQVVELSGANGVQMQCENKELEIINMDEE